MARFASACEILLAIENLDLGEREYLLFAGKVDANETSLGPLAGLLVERPAELGQDKIAVPVARSASG